MARRRFFIDQVRNGTAEIRGEDAHHLTRVLRVEAGQIFEITDQQRVWLASVETARRDLVRFAVSREIAAADPPAVKLYLALIKFERFEWAVEKATELAVTSIVPIEAARSERGLFAGAQKRVDRWRRIAHEASEQSRRLRVPEISAPVPFSQALKDQCSRQLWLDEQPGALPLLNAFEWTERGSLALMVGPEGGWTPDERAALAAAAWTAASLGPAILRAETAVCAALAVIAQKWLTA